MRNTRSVALYLFTLLSLSVLLSSCFTTQQRPTTTPPSATEIQLRQELVRYALAFQGKKYKYAGTDPLTGFDCSGFTSYVFKQFKINIPSASSAQAREGRPVDLRAVLPGDLIIFGRNRNNIQHVALVVERNRNGIEVVHSTTSRGVIRENISTSSYWEPRILFARNVFSK